MVSLPNMVTEIGIESGLSVDVLELVLHAGLVVKLVLLVLLFFSVISWAIIFVKFRMFRLAEKESRIFLNHFWSSKDFSRSFGEAKKMVHSPVATLFKSGYVDLERIRQDGSSPNPPKTPGMF